MLLVAQYLSVVDLAVRHHQLRIYFSSYTGEIRRRLADIFREHLRSTRNTTDLPVGRHFTSTGHNVIVSMTQLGFGDTLERRRGDARIIFKYKTLHPRELNTDFAFKLLPAAYSSARA